MKGVLLAGTLALAAGAQLGPPPGGGAETATGLLVAKQGAVSLRRAGWPKPQPAGLGAELRLGDTVTLSRNAVAVIQCPDQETRWQPPPGLESGVFKECPSRVVASLVRLGRKGLRARQAGDLEVLTPSLTVLLEPLPWIRWRAVPGAERYKVSVTDSRRSLRPIWGPALVSGTEVQYLGGPALEPGVEYFVRVESEASAPTATPLLAQGLPFMPGTEADRRRLEATTTSLATSGLEPLSRDLALAAFLRAHELRSAALELLDKAARGSDAAAVHLARAGLLEEVGARASAADAYRHVLDLGGRQHDRDSEAEALLGLARTAASSKEQFETARRAAEVFRQLGDAGRAIHAMSLASDQP
jgi:hypothetical protein